MSTGSSLPNQIDEVLFEQKITAFGQSILESISHRRPSALQAEFYAEKFLSWAMGNEDLKISLFRFVDVLPGLPDAPSVIRHAHEYFEPLEGVLPDLLRRALRISPHSVTARIAAQAIKQQVRFVADRFIVGESPQKSLSELRRIRKDGMAFTVDLLGEAAVSELEARVYLERYLELITCLAKESATWKEKAAIIPGHRAENTITNVSVKLSSLFSQSRPVASDQNIEIFVARFCEILAEAKKHAAFVYLDMEDSALTSVTIETFKRSLERKEYRDYPFAGIVLQAYLRRTEADVYDLISWAKARGTPIAVRLVKGAYWDTETILSVQSAWPIPVWQKKENSDASYEKLSRILLENYKHVLPAFGSHNVRSLSHAVQYAELLGIERTQYEVQALYGMGDVIMEAFKQKGLLVRQYAPVGELIPGMGYLVRRLLENTSNEGFLRLSMHEAKDPALLLRRPNFDAKDTGDLHLKQQVAFRNCPFTDFSSHVERNALDEALEALKNQRIDGIGAEVRPIIAGVQLSSDIHYESRCPEANSIVMSKVNCATREQAAAAIECCKKYFPTWQSTPVESRCQILERAASTMESSRVSLSALIILESGKSWTEADADVAEAIDFCRYYAAQARKLFTKQNFGSLPGERNVYFYEPRGLTTVIAPWNFPLAIPCGMFAASLVSGNCTLLKPAEQTSGIAQALFQIFLESGLPPEAAAFLPGYGEDIGAFLGSHPDISSIVFTGSKAVGLSLIERGGKVQAGSRHVVRVIAEMGGKNAIIVDDDADLDEAIKGVIQSAFGFQGQKCSACSRVYVVGGTYKRFEERLREAVLSLQIGPASNPASFMGPVIDQEAYDRIQRVIQNFRKLHPVVAEGKLGEECDAQGYYIAPIVFADAPSDSPLNKSEIFGPVLSLNRAKTFDEAVDAALDTEYALTGAVYSRSPQHIEKAIRDFAVGNLYINRGSTGALVMRQPFGGAAMSGVGSKAGGPDYLLQFVIPRVVTENTMRRGFAPLEDVVD